MIAALNADLDKAQELGIFFSETQPPLSQIANLGAPRKKKEDDICIKLISGVYHLKVMCIANH